MSDDVHPLAKLRGNPPSNEAIAKAFWGRSHCQFHNAQNCQFVEDIISDARLLDAGLLTFYEIESARYNDL